jgi:hypothetical protein
MLEKFTEKTDPVKVSEIDSESLETYEPLLPQEINYLLKEFGVAHFLGGFFWTVDPQEYKEILDEIYVPLKTPAICFARDAFGGLYVWEDFSIIYIDIRFGYSKVVGRKPSVFFNGIMTDWGYFSKEVKEKNFEEAKMEFGLPNEDECYGYFPLLALGGAEKVENIQIVKIREHLSLIAQTTGQIG